MKFVTDNEVIEVVNDDNGYSINPSLYQAELDYYTHNIPVINGTYIADKVDWFVIREIVSTNILHGRVKQIIETDEEKNSYSQFDFDESVVY